MRILYLGLIVFTGCAVGPNYKAPDTNVDRSFARANQPSLSTNAPTVRWWRSFGDDTLNQLIDTAVATNTDLRIATANLREARALHRLANFDFAPTVTANAGYENRRNSAIVSRPGADRHLEIYDVGFDAIWELDLFGGVRRSTEAARAQAQSAEAARRDVLISVIAEVVRNYFELRGTQNQLEVARRNATNQTETVQITQARLEGGRGTQFDVARARAQLNATLAIIPPLETQIARSIHRLSVLSGRQPGALLETLNQPAPLPNAPELVGIGDPTELLRRRPDVRIAERDLATATARIGVATADLFPRVTFIGRVGFQAQTFSGLTQNGGDTWSFGPRITWAALDIGRVHARIKAAGARADAQLANYERTVLGALEETENALVEWGREQARRDYLRESALASEEAAALARQRYEVGAADFLNVLDAERVLLEGQNQLAASQTRAATALVAVYKALGAGWEIETE
ncbi:MAG TPA: efflux transporter outer membrane subunit [Candidatus Binatia bacterium]|nr:efflux transporter outer membrane subunit [Candidatus Binatia bacterium]